MRSESHTLISTLLGVVNQWRRREGWSRETVVQQIVEAHERIQGALVTGIVFDPPTRDTTERMKVNADRVFRWLDDGTKDTNLVSTQVAIWRECVRFRPSTSRRSGRVRS